MAVCKPAFATLFKTLLSSSYQLTRHGRRSSFLNSQSIRLLSFSTPEDAAAERRRRKRRLLIEPPLSSNRAQSSSPSQKSENPNAPKIPEPISELSGKRLELHNKILKLIRENDLEEAALYTKHSVYSNCRPTIYTVNAVLTALLRQSKYADLLSLHRFIIQAGIAPTIITHNLIFQTYLDCRRPEIALENYKLLINEAPFNPSPTTYRIMIKGLVDNGMVDKALEIKGEMIELKGFSPDPLVYHYLMTGLARGSDGEGVFKIFTEFKDKLGVAGDDVIEDGVIYGGLMKGYFLRGMEKEAMECYETAVGMNSKVKMSDVAYNSVLDALIKNGMFDEGFKLFDRMLKEHNPPLRLSVNLGSFNVIVDGFCSHGRFNDAIEVFGKIEEYKCVPDVLSFNNLIDQLCANGMLAEAENMYGLMDGKGVKPDEYTFGLLMDTCFKDGRTDDGAAYFKTMVDLGLRPNLAVYNRLVDQLVKVGKLDEAKSFYDLMVKKLKMDNTSYEFMMGALSNADRLDDMLKMVDEMLDDQAIGLDEELQEFAKGELRKQGREEDLGKLMEDKERKKAEAKAREAEAAEAAKRSARAAIASLIPSKFFNKEAETDSEQTNESSSPTGQGAAEVSAINSMVDSSSSSNSEEEFIINADKLVDRFPNN